MLNRNNRVSIRDRQSMLNDTPWFFRHFNTIFTIIFVLAFTIITAQIVFGAYMAWKVKNEGLKNVITEVWEGPEKP